MPRVVRAGDAETAGRVRREIDGDGERRVVDLVQLDEPDGVCSRRQLEYLVIDVKEAKATAPSHSFVLDDRDRVAGDRDVRRDLSRAAVETRVHVLEHERAVGRVRPRDAIPVGGSVEALRGLREEFAAGGAEENAVRVSRADARRLILVVA